MLSVDVNRIINSVQLLRNSSDTGVWIAEITKTVIPIVFVIVILTRHVISNFSMEILVSVVERPPKRDWHCN
uniref:Serpentine receptor class gamma n=1 Tax=Caenorhabditis tropicalis TaxID=1561998 RepID=A0A1I7U3H1_9PELO